MIYSRPPAGAKTMATSCGSGLLFDLGPPRHYPITCHECGATGEQVGKVLPKGWRVIYGMFGQHYYCPNVICWDRSWLRSREEWASA